MHNKIHSMIFLLSLIKNADTENGWNERIPESVWIVWAETRYLLSEQKKFQNKLKNIDEVYQLVFFHCIMFLSYRVAFLCNVLVKLIIYQKVLYDIFYEKVVKWCFGTVAWIQGFFSSSSHFTACSKQFLSSLLTSLTVLDDTNSFLLVLFNGLITARLFKRLW